MLTSKWQGPPMKEAKEPTTNLLGLGHQELADFVATQGEPRFRARQLFRAMYARRTRAFAGMTDLGCEFRDRLAARCCIDYPEVVREFVSKDGAVRFLLRMHDGKTVEAVYMPEESRTTFCISSQAGCAVDCRFCFTALLRLQRNLTAGEILGQVLALLAARPAAPGGRLNIVFMGMGEPLLNLRPVLAATAILTDPDGLGISPRRITLSTSGIIPGIHQLARETVRPKLAISLNASSEEQRLVLMPITHKYPLRALLDACREYPLRHGELLTFEYVMLDGWNDSPADAARVAVLLKDLRAKVNLIPYNSGPGLPYRASPLPRVLAFQQVLADHHIPAFIRISRGQDVSAACGQLNLAGAAGEAFAAKPSG
jgi:23S rRNA (adenine2503-C2)-methyltransferase